MATSPWEGYRGVTGWNPAPKPEEPYGGPGGGGTYQEGDRTGGKRGIKGARERLWSEEFGGGFLGRQVLDPAVMEYIKSSALGTAPSAAEYLMRSGLEQQQKQAYGMAAGAQGAGVAPGLAFRQAQEAAGTAGLEALSGFGAMRAEEMARNQGMYASAALQQQGVNDAAAIAREQLLQQLITTQYTGKQQENLQNQQFWQQLLAKTGGGAMAGLMAAGPYGALAGGVAGAGTAVAQKKG